MLVSPQIVAGGIRKQLGLKLEATRVTLQPGVARAVNFRSLALGRIGTKCCRCWPQTPHREVQLLAENDESTVRAVQPAEKTYDKGNCIFLVELSRIISKFYELLPINARV
jgi:hypothetical protein